MKSLSNDIRIAEPKVEQGQLSQKTMTVHSQKKLQQLIESNVLSENTIGELEKEIEKLERENKELDEQLEKKREELQQAKNDIEEQEQKDQSEEQHDMNNWIANLQNYSGVSQQVIDSLCCLEYEGTGEEEICLSCYQPMQQGTLTKYLPCAHLFHSDCINAHLKVNKLCPACGEEVAH